MPITGDTSSGERTMKSLFFACFTTLLITLADPVSADSNSGTITFIGAVSNGSCNIDLGEKRVTSVCYDPNLDKVVTTVADPMNAKSLAGLPVDTKMQWFNPERTKGILYVTYL